MLKPICLAISLGILACPLPSGARVAGNAASEALVKQGNLLLSQGKHREAYEAFRQAHSADPQASLPLSSAANLLASLVAGAPAESRAALRAQAEATAAEALRLDERDPLAQEALRLLQDEGLTSLHPPSQAAADLIAEGELLFIQKQYDEARGKYTEAARLDPLSSKAWVAAGDCYFAQRRWGEAEQLFRKATEIEPSNSQAWRFLADAQLMQGRRRPAESALFMGIGAHPGQRPTWEKLAALLRADGIQLKRLALVPLAVVSQEPGSAQKTIALQATEPKSDSLDRATWLAHAIGRIQADNGNATPFKAEVAAWKMAVTAAKEMSAGGKGALADPGLIAVMRLAESGQLEPAILLLMYRESFRAELEEWKRAHPDGIRAFVIANGLQP